MVRKLKEYEVMEVLSDHANAFNTEFNYVADFINNRMKLKIPSPPASLIVVDDSDHEDLEEKINHYEEVESKNEKYFRKIRKVIKLLKEKILFQ